MEKILTKDEAYQKTLDAIKMEYDTSISIINNRIKEAANNMKTYITVTENDNLEFTNEFGSKMKILFVSLGYNVKLFTMNEYKLIISWNME